MSDPVQQLSDELEAELEAAFLDAIEAVTDHVDVPSLIEAAERGDEDVLAAYVAEQLEPFRVLLTAAFARAGTIAAGRLGLAFDPAEQVATAARVSAVSSIMRPIITDTAKAMLQAAFRSTFAPAVVVGSVLAAAVPAQGAEKAILVREAIGLSPAQGASLSVFRAALERAVAQQSEPERRPAFTRESAILPELPAQVLRHLSAPQRSVIEKAARLQLDRDQAEDLVAQQRRVLLKVRAGSIGTAGAVTITNAGESASWQQAVSRHDLGPEWRRYWRDRGDERVRHIHSQVKSLNPNGVAIDEPFATALGPCHAPPLEAGCRCRVELRRAA